jgi:hypothetical protein
MMLSQCVVTICTCFLALMSAYVLGVYACRSEFSAHTQQGCDMKRTKGFLRASYLSSAQPGPDSEGCKPARLNAGSCSDT